MTSRIWRVTDRLTNSQYKHNEWHLTDSRDEGSLGIGTSECGSLPYLLLLSLCEAATLKAILWFCGSKGDSVSAWSVYEIE